MPNTESCKKRLRQDIKRNQNNNFVKKTLKTLTKKLRSNDIELSERTAMVSNFYSKIDKAAKVGVIHKKTASRKKSRIMAALNKEKKQHVEK